MTVWFECELPVSITAPFEVASLKPVGDDVPSASTSSARALITEAGRVADAPSVSTLVETSKSLLVVLSVWAPSPLVVAVATELLVTDSCEALMVTSLFEDSVAPLRTLTSASEVGVLAGRAMVPFAVELAPSALAVALELTSRSRVVTRASTLRLPAAVRVADDWISVIVLPP